MVDHTIVECPRCKGSKGGVGFVTRADGCGPEWIDCRACEGRGEMTVARRNVFERGERIRDRRLALDLGLREFATEAGLRVMHLSDVENGRGMPEMFAAAEATLARLEMVPHAD